MIKQMSGQTDKLITLSVCWGCQGKTAVRVSGARLRQSRDLAGLAKITHFALVDTAALFHPKQAKFRMLRLLGQIKFSKNNTLMQARFFQKDMQSLAIRQGKSIQETYFLFTFPQSFKSLSFFPQCQCSAMFLLPSSPFYLPHVSFRQDTSPEVTKPQCSYSSCP